MPGSMNWAASRRGDMRNPGGINGCTKDAATQIEDILQPGKPEYDRLGAMPT